MANEIQELLADIKDERLRARLSAAVAELRKTKKFGLVFEEHIPELPRCDSKVPDSKDSDARYGVHIGSHGKGVSLTFGGGF